MRTVRRHLLVWWQASVQAIRRDLQFRSQAVATLLTSIVELGLALVPVLILASVAGTASGWSAPLALAVSGAYGISAAVLDCFVGPNCARMDRYIREGELDLLLMRPVRTGFLAAVRWVAPSELAAMVPATGLLVIGLRLAEVRPSAASVTLAAGWALVGMTAFAFLWLNLSYWRSGWMAPNRSPSSCCRCGPRAGIPGRTSPSRRGSCWPPRSPPGCWEPCLSRPCWVTGRRACSWSRLLGWSPRAD